MLATLTVTRDTRQGADSKTKNGLNMMIHGRGGPEIVTRQYDVNVSETGVGVASYQELSGCVRVAEFIVEGRRVLRMPT